MSHALSRTGSETKLAPRVRNRPSVHRPRWPGTTLATWIPLVTFRERFCSGGRQMQDEGTQALMNRLRTEIWDWSDAGVDTVDVSGYWKR